MFSVEDTLRVLVLHLRSSHVCFSLKEKVLTWALIFEVKGVPCVACSLYPKCSNVFLLFEKEGNDVEILFIRERVSNFRESLSLLRVMLFGLELIFFTKMRKKRVYL